MQQKEVKIIGLRLDKSMGILQSFEVEFNEKGLIAIKGAVGAGKTTLKRSIQLGTAGSDALKDDKELYGPIQQEVQLLDGNHKIFVGCKSDKKGALVYELYSKDESGKKSQNPIIDGVKATPAAYLEKLQTALTWRMEEITSENLVTQRKILLELYRDELEKVGVIYDKNHPDYSSGIIGQIADAESERTRMDVLRKEVGGFAGHLKDKGYDVSKRDTLPKYQETAKLEEEISKLKFSIDNAVENAQKAKQAELNELKARADKINYWLKEKDREIERRNEIAEMDFRKRRAHVEAIERMFDEVETRYRNLLIMLKLDPEKHQIFSDEIYKAIPAMPLDPDQRQRIQFEEAPDGTPRCISASSDGFDDEISDQINLLANLRQQYSELLTKQVSIDAQEEVKASLEQAESKLLEIRELNKVAQAAEAFYNWQESDKKVTSLKTNYAKRLAEIDTGVAGLQIGLTDDDQIYLAYNGTYDPMYFGNPQQEYRKVSSYSGTQKPVICLLLQAYLLSKKPKALRYLWIDNVPIDQKTKALLSRMCNELNLTVFVNITGDFDRSGLENGEILIEGGEVFFEKGDGQVVFEEGGEL